MHSNRSAWSTPTRCLAAAAVCWACACMSGSERDFAASVARGEYLVSIAACDDCHSPKVQTDRGPEVDMARRLSGHPAGSPMAAIPKASLGGATWSFVGNHHMTAWAGSWGTSFASNLTPHVDGLELWTEEQFVSTLRTGLHLGAGRPVLPPMPWPAYRHMTDEDLRAVYAFLKTLPPVANVVPQPLPPEP